MSGTSGFGRKRQDYGEFKASLVILSDTVSYRHLDCMTIQLNGGEAETGREKEEEEKTERLARKKMATI